MNQSPNQPALFFDYYYGQESEQFVFYRIPKLLFKDEAFRGLSNDAKLLYGLLLDRMSLSRKNHWFDDQNRTFIIYSIEEIMSDLNCSRGKAVKSMAELDTKNGIGLVEKVRRGMGQPNILYVKNFIRKDDNNSSPNDVSEASSPENTLMTSESPDTFGTSEIPENTIKSKIQTSRNANYDIHEVQFLDSMNSTAHTSTGSRLKLQQVHDLDGNNINNNYTEYDKTDKLNLPHGGMDESPSVQLLEQIKSNIEWDHLSTYSSHDEKNLYTTLLSIIEDTLSSNSREIFIGNQSYARIFVEKRLLSLNSEHFRYIYESIRYSPVQINNTYGYLLSALFHAPVTMDQYYSQQMMWEQNRGYRPGEHKVS